jgi:RES domain-containing protein
VRTAPFGALYTSLNADTAREIARYFTVPPIGGFLQASIELRLTRVLDLTRPDGLARAGLHDNQLIEPRYSLTQEIGRHAWEDGFEGLVTPSAAIPGERNLAIFLDNQRPKWRIGLSGFAKVRLT